MLFRISLLCPTDSLNRAVGEISRQWFTHLAASFAFVVSLSFAALVAKLKENPKLHRINTALSLALYFLICSLTLLWLVLWRVLIV
mmetsp:Transcript_28050/g.50233  ORF Transcript_28050/g.50233 Transcript_28050/m.50233 type:complete len:86 (-) Transcript_28050:36-293(-)